MSRFFWAVTLVLCASMAAMPAVAADDSGDDAIEAPPPLPSDGDAPEPSRAPATKESDDEEEEGGSCFSSPLVWIVGGVVALAAVVVAVAGGVVGVVCALPLCTSCGYASLLGCGYGTVGSAVGCALCSSSTTSGGAFLLGGMALAALGGVAGGAVLATGDMMDLDAPTTLAGAGLLGATAVGTAALVGVGVALALSEPDETAPPPAKTRARAEEKSPPLVDVAGAAIAF